jgi:hypothetical protein
MYACQASDLPSGEREREEEIEKMHMLVMLQTYASVGPYP